MKNNKVKKMIGGLIKIFIAGVVLLFLGLKSLDFFLFTTPPDQWYYAYLGLGLTGGGVLAYLLLFMWDAETPIQKTVAILMLAVCIGGELVTAGYGLQVNAWKAGAFEMADSDFSAMVLAVQILGFAHALALVAYVAGDKLAEAFRDEDGDGIPNAFDRDYKGKNQKPVQNMPRIVPVNANAADVEQVKLQEPENPQNPPRH